MAAVSRILSSHSDQCPGADKWCSRYFGGPVSRRPSPIDLWVPVPGSSSLKLLFWTRSTHRERSPELGIKRLPEAPGSMATETASAAAGREEARPPWQRLEGRVVLVTGASSGIGRDLCLDLARAGCRIVAAARRLDRLRSLCDEINGAGAVRAMAVELDVSAGSAAIEASVERAWAAFGRIDVLVNNAGVRGNVHSPLDWSEEEWNNVMRTNLTGLWLVTKYVCSRMRDAKQKGSVINISSIGGVNRGHLPGGLAYIASKAGVNAITKVMALELGADNIRVNCIAPGIFKSEITERLLQREWVNRVAERIVPLRKYGTSDPALTSLVRYLIHDSSEYVSGNIFVVDGGVILPGVPIFSSL